MHWRMRILPAVLDRIDPPTRTLPITSSPRRGRRILTTTANHTGPDFYLPRPRQASPPTSSSTLKSGAAIPGVAGLERILPNMHRLVRALGALLSNIGNDLGNIDRAAQRENRINSGIRNIVIQDQAVTESMGLNRGRYARSISAPSDVMISRTRRRLLTVALALAVNGTVPPGVDDPEDLFRARAVSPMPTTRSTGRRPIRSEMVPSGARRAPGEQAAEQRRVRWK